MRAFLAIAAAVLVALVAAEPHHHAAGQDTQVCQACLTRTGEEARNAAADVTPRPVALAQVVAAPGLPPVTGAPLGAIPGQSPPRA